MQVYFQNILRCFIKKERQIGQKEKRSDKVDFILTDVDEDGMPEIIFLFSAEAGLFVGILEREGMQWKLCGIRPLQEKDKQEDSIESLLKPVTSIAFNEGSLGAVFTLEKLFGEEEITFIGLVEGEIYHCLIEAETEIDHSSSRFRENHQRRQQDIPSTTTVPGTSGSAPKSTPIDPGIISPTTTPPIPAEPIPGTVVPQPVPTQPIPAEVPMPTEPVPTGPLVPDDPLVLPPVPEQPEVPGTDELPGVSDSSPPQPESQVIISPVLPEPIVVPAPGQAQQSIPLKEVQELETFDKEVIDYVQGDVTGSGGFEEVYLIGNIEDNTHGSYITDMELVVRVESKQETIRIPLEGEGYTPIIFLGDFTGSRIDDITVTIFRQPAANNPPLSSYTYIYSVEEGTPKVIFDNTTFDQEYTGTVNFMDNYKVEVETAKPAKRYRMDIGLLDPAYLSTVYDENGVLLEDKQGHVSGIVFLNPADIDRDRIYEFSSIQVILDEQQELDFGLVETFVKWNPVTETFEPIEEYISIYGQPLDEVEE